jgi:aerobic carbon-monoxide dehydrogenase large subunit
MIHSKDGSPMKMGRIRRSRGKVRYVGDHVAVVIAETLAQARDAAEVGRSTTSAAGGRRSGQGAIGAPQIHDVAPNNTIYDWHLGDKAATTPPSRGGQARHQARHRQQPAGAQRHGAARGDRRIRQGTRIFTLWTHEPEPACGAARALGLRRHGARAQAARDRARRRRRLRLEDLHLSRGDVCLWASKKVGVR